MDELQTLRERIDAIDEEVIFLIKKRMEVVRRIGKVKKKQGLPARDDKRWEEALEKKISQAEELGLEATLIKEMYTPIHSHALEVEQEA